MTARPPYATRDLVAGRLPLIFPEGTPNRIYCIRELAASTVFAALYIGAVEGSGRFLGPVHVYRMTREQAALADDADRDAYAATVLRKNGAVAGSRWYADNTREPIRDETLRDGLVAIGSVLRREDLPTTSGQPRYALRAAFAALFDPALEGEALETAIADFQETHLSKGALARVTIMRAGAVANTAGIRVTFPNGDTRLLAPGPSSVIAQAVIEVFAKRFLAAPAMLWLSESGNKVVLRDDAIASAIGLKIEADRNLPDIILADLGRKEPLILFVEVVATDGAITDRRRDALHAVTDAAGFDRKQIAFLTAYQDRQSAGFKKTVAQLAWGSFAWFVSEPGQLLVLHDGAADGRPFGSLPWTVM
ncbi:MULTISPECIES: BsuBI/PstI family type II restriction endonuclease [unclassified Mesorhizobium]|uniref:BsuBI/PstI family type II restriction endonuclease n=1 Tax=unclassified Mesorhizobium TaxID=325217 RepID=UPI00112C5EC5|nr:MULTISPECIES: BsuBI/PstI family type II restriction endonuclease [unclassified Mesorhizobium]TPJ48829.1 restriction endonuclease [Mesorhizobium sp. B2-6-6]MCA0003725.1 restriction endonuclease [Mesorhizobium sp. B264B2A]MCA0010162.1 restriction endonuclease [Mesorhizobium sp. B264B1B]MCA0021005.1 restriction endonuclease [Mesorhizobium sp. B264B1A]TPI53755.1 restriction endonuclease [Mesorhizobium sp. B3-1-1]